MHKKQQQLFLLQIQQLGWHYNWQQGNGGTRLMLMMIMMIWYDDAVCSKSSQRNTHTRIHAFHTLFSTSLHFAACFLCIFLCIVIKYASYNRNVVRMSYICTFYMKTLKFKRIQNASVFETPESSFTLLLPYTLYCCIPWWVSTRLNISYIYRYVCVTAHAILLLSL